MGLNENRELSVLLPKERIERLTRLNTVDKQGNLWYPVSAFCGEEYTLYMVSNIPKGIKKRLVYSARNIKGRYPLFLNIEKSNSKIKNGASFCIPEISGTVIFKGYKPEMSPNTNVKNEIKIGLFGSKGKTKIAQAFTHNENNDEYIADVEINNVPTKLLLFDSIKYENDHKLRNLLYQQVQYLLFFFDSSDSKSFDYLSHLYKEANSVCKGDFKYAIVAYGGIFSGSENSYENHSKFKLIEVKQKFRCEVFEVYSNDMKIINGPFYFFLQSTINKMKSSKLTKSIIIHFLI